MDLYICLNPPRRNNMLLPLANPLSTRSPAALPLQQEAIATTTSLSALARIFSRLPSLYPLLT
jgi:hypothetical protein